MKCALCGQVFDQAARAGACANCSMLKNCGLLRCPNCGFETPAEPEWLRKAMRSAQRAMHSAWQAINKLRRKSNREID
ncbi:MAG: hypothetical protein HYV36_00290 [Lentisphaerae bacterium]|nr:hypothetical protein [Lentisphaerota bacterium]